MVITITIEIFFPFKTKIKKYKKYKNNFYTELLLKKKKKKKSTF